MTRPASIGRGSLQTLAEGVRSASRAGAVLRLGEVWPGTEEEYLALISGSEAGSFSDIVLTRAGGLPYLYSNHHMTLPYARAAAGAAAGDHARVIAETVRADSATYPRPTPMSTFLNPPFGLSVEEATAAVAGMRREASYADIEETQSSNGDLFLFSMKHMSRAQAESKAEWIAVGQFDNP